MDVLEWAQMAEPGARVTYVHRTKQDILYGENTAALPSAMMAHMKGLVFLAQRRTYDGYDYEATRVSLKVARILGMLETPVEPTKAVGLISHDEWSEGELKVLKEDWEKGIPPSHTAITLERTLASVNGKRNRMGYTERAREEA